MGICKIEFAKEVRKQIWLAGPLLSVGLLTYSLQVISVMFVGHLGELALSGASMASSFASVTGFNLLMGLASALDTLCGQSFGAERHRMLGVHTQRAMAVVSVVSFFLAIIWANTERILIALHQDHLISQEAGKYALFMIPSIFAFGLYQCLLKFLQTQNIVFPMVTCSGVVALLHVLLCWLLVLKSGLGSRGAALANSISYWANVLLISLYIKFSSSCAKTWTGFSKDGLQKIFAFLKLAVPSALMLCLKVWSFELVVLLSGLLPNPKLETSVLSICLNTFGVLWMIPFGLSAAVSTRVSNELGAGKPEAALLAARVVFILVVIEGLIMGLVMMIIRKSLGQIYSNEKEVVRYVASMMPVLAISSFLDGIQSVLSGFSLR
ncbi:Multi antimicrobial extrusion protein [Trema orientale]|uniref:Multi antimicrobial extrusion protein n=1 Tax=Trema orientale TaxID=63057 RepID=A0A2P5E9U1_TREOI|nr:Multi antimicrobial extrusion protein [Trema orientale]